MICVIYDKTLKDDISNETVRKMTVEKNRGVVKRAEIAMIRVCEKDGKQELGGGKKFCS